MCNSIKSRLSIYDTLLTIETILSCTLTNNHHHQIASSTQQTYTHHKRAHTHSCPVVVSCVCVCACVGFCSHDRRHDRDHHHQHQHRKGGGRGGGEGGATRTLSCTHGPSIDGGGTPAERAAMQRRRLRTPVWARSLSYSMSIHLSLLCVLEYSVSTSFYLSTVSLFSVHISSVLYLFHIYSAFLYTSSQYFLICLVSVQTLSFTITLTIISPSFIFVSIQVLSALLVFSKCIMINDINMFCVMLSA